jgi:ribokinase
LTPDEARIVVVGSLNMDLVGCAPRIPVPGETISGHTFFDAPGGKGANQAYAAARLGGNVAMLGRVGNDDFGRRMRSNLESAGCNVTHVYATNGAPSGTALIFVSDDGQNSIMVLPGANHLLSSADLDAARLWSQSSLLLLQLETPLETVRAAALKAHSVGARVILDPAPAQPLPDELIRLADIITPNETEAAILAGIPPARMRAEQALDIARRLRSRGAGNVIVKLGDQGCLLLTEEGHWLLPTPSVQAVDATAAGDVFNGALAVAVSEGRDLKVACRFANAAAAISVTRRGAQPSAPSRHEVEKMLNR